MRNMSFMLTKPAFRAQTKTVTRRLGWGFLVPGEVVMGVEKAMGLKAGERIVRMGPIEVVDIRSEPLRAMTDDLEYGFSECRKEGFGDDPILKDPRQFVLFFCKSHKGCTPETVLNRIQFEYLNEPI